MGTTRRSATLPVMASPPTPPRPRLVRPDEPPPTPGPAEPAIRRTWLLPLAIAAALVAAAGWGIEARRASGLAGQVTELTAALGAARAEIGARERHLESVRSAAAEAEAGVVALRALAERDPTAAVPPATEPQAPAGAE